MHQVLFKLVKLEIVEGVIEIHPSTSSILVGSEAESVLGNLSCLHFFAPL